MMFGMRRPNQMTATQAARHNALQQAYRNQAQAAQQTALMSALHNGGSHTWVSTSATASIYTTTSATATTQTGVYGSGAAVTALIHNTLKILGDVIVADGSSCKITLPDGAIITVGTDGSFTINDKDAKVTYRANRMRDFNPFINASDKIEGFIRFCGALGIKQDEMLSIPIKLFIGWLIIEAAHADGEGEDQDVGLLEGIHQFRRPRCVRCGRFLARKLAARRIAFCRPVCLEQELAAA